jgi:hypothetical protein
VRERHVTFPSLSSMVTALDEKHLELLRKCIVSRRQGVVLWGDLALELEEIAL